MNPNPALPLSHRAGSHANGLPDECPAGNVTAEWLQKQERAFWANRRLNYLCVALAVLAVCCFVGSLGLVSAGCPIPAAVWPTAILLAVIAFLGVHATHGRWRQRCEAVARCAAEGDARMIAPLAAGLSMDEYPEHPAWRRAVGQALTAILSRLDAEEAISVSDRSWERLASFLRMWYSPEIEDLQVAILRAAALAGAKPILPAAERLARTRPAAPPEERVHAAAADCLEVIHDRIREVSRNRALLRPSASPDGSPDHLLRPAADADSQSDALLRPAEP